MTTQFTLPRPPQVPDDFVFPDPPEDREDKMTLFDHLTITGAAHYLAEHLGNHDTTLVAGERYMSPIVTGSMSGLRFPDMIVAFDVDPEAYRERNAYVVSEQGKPPDFVLEVASRSTGRIDVRDKPADYARLGIKEYWRFDETGEYHGSPLGGDRLVDGVYVPIEIAELDDGSLQGYSPVLNVYLRWEHHKLVFYDPATNRPIASLRTERERADREHVRAEIAEARADREHSRAEGERDGRLAERRKRFDAEARVDAERQARLAAEARIRELEAQDQIRDE